MENKCSIKECNVVCMFKANLIKSNFRQHISHSSQLFDLWQLHNYCVFIHVWDADAAEGVTGLIPWCSPEGASFILPSSFSLPLWICYLVGSFTSHSTLLEKTTGTWRETSWTCPSLQDVSLVTLYFLRSS